MNIQRIIAVFFLLSLTISACKKGENDPFFSLKTRKARLSADWTVESATITDKDSLLTFDGTTVTLSALADPGVDEREYGLEWTMSFTRDGEYEVIEVRDYPKDFFDGDSNPYTLTLTEKGIWQFTGGNSDVKTKEQLLMLPTETSSMRSDQGVNVNVEQQTNPNEGRIYDIDRLASDELVLKYEVTYSSAFDEYVESAEIKLKQ